MAVAAEHTMPAAPVMDQVHRLGLTYQQVADMVLTEIINTQEALAVAVLEET